MKRRINPRKLLHSKWTAVSVSNKEKHFIVVAVYKDEADVIDRCKLEAVINQNDYVINWHELEDPEQWRQGWC